MSKLPPASSPHPEHVRLVNYSILAFGLLILGLGCLGLKELPHWIWVALAAGVAVCSIGAWGLRSGAMTSLDTYVTTGIACLTITSVGAAILHRLGSSASA